jgi:hypothetical protein
LQPPAFETPSFSLSEGGLRCFPKQRLPAQFEIVNPSPAICNIKIDEKSVQEFSRFAHNYREGELDARPPIPRSSQPQAPGNQTKPKPGAINVVRFPSSSARPFRFPACRVPLAEHVRGHQF